MRHDVLTTTTTPPRSPGAATSAPRRVSSPAELALALAFAPLHKHAFGLAVGAALACVLVLLTAGALLRDPAGRFPIGLLGQYFYGFSHSWTGVAVIGAWGLVVGFVMGWFAAFCRNLALAVWLLYVRARADLASTRDMLDHI